ncbi:O-antigen ligase [Rufibacter sp. XAAS-G3-1]|uniref:O-antigen ligase family protein n=1 Tax=Rufibacter sp. XAAS-G3-1 TaxID=2729134 RepID=UPI0015E6C6CB|nr:O-antigen ligase family protein [Rufibacter sp. XAAS-G3-1]
MLTALEYLKVIPPHAHSLATLDWTFFSYHIPQSIRFHAPYFSLYIGTCLIIHSYFLYTLRYSEHRKTFLFHLFFWLFFFSFLALLSSRTALVATVVVLAVAAVYLALKARKYLLLAAVVVFTAGTSLLIFEKVTYLKTKFSQNAGVTERKMMWLSALDIIKERPITGVSPGGSRDAVVESYRKHNFKEGVEARFDAHNQFLMYGVSLGLPGVLVFLLLLLFLLKAAYQRQDFILFAFVAVFGICCLTESLLQRRDGTLLFSFVTSLLLFAPKDQPIPRQTLVKQKKPLKN